jgi:hypothetical protein
MPMPHALRVQVLVLVWNGTFGGCARLGQVQREDWPQWLLALEPCQR